MTRSRYSILLYLAAPLLLLYLIFRAIKHPDYWQRWGERFGLTKLQHTDLLFHCVSMGETLAAIPLIKHIQVTRPELTITVTTMSPTGSKEVIKAFADRVQHCYLPFDINMAMKRFLNQVAPKACIVMETELWPNLIYQAKQRGVKLLLANARLSAKSAAKYQQQQQLSLPMLRSLDLILAQSSETTERFIELGVEPERIKICGSVKFDLNVEPQVIEQAQELRKLWQREEHPVWVAGSVHPGEFDGMLQTHKGMLEKDPQSLLIFVPRHPEQFDAAEKKLAQQGFNYVRRSRKEPVTEDTQVILADTMGELMLLYGVADHAFVGGTLIERGGHNPLEPAALGVPVFIGPHHFNFAEISVLLQQAGALTIVEDSQDLLQQIMAMEQGSERYQLASKAGLTVVVANRGAQAKQQKFIAKLIESV